MSSAKSQSIFRSKHKRNYTTFANKLLYEPSLSGKAKWVLMYLLSKPEDWQTRISDIVKHCTDGPDAIKSAIKELKQAGYLVKVRVICPETRKVLRWETHVFDEPQGITETVDEMAENPEVENPASGLPPAGFPECGKSTTTKEMTLESNDQENVLLTDHHQKGEGGGKVNELGMDNAREIAHWLCAEYWYHQHGKLYCEFKVTDYLVRACVGHTKETAELAMMAYWEAMDAYAQIHQDIKMPERFLASKLKEREAPSDGNLEHYRSIHRDVKKNRDIEREIRHAIEVKPTTLRWLELALQCGLIVKYQEDSNTDYLYGYQFPDEDFVRCDDFGKLPKGYEHVTIEQMREYLDSAA